jgi:hypothetical protein
LWWHPCNFALNRNENLSLLEHVLDDFDDLSRTEGMETLTMSDVSDRVTQGEAAEAGEDPTTMTTRADPRRIRPALPRVGD